MRQEDLNDDPVFIDLETRSSCDLPLAGGWNYAKHPTTHLLTVAWSPAAGEYHVWFPWHPTIREDYIQAQTTKYTIHKGIDFPAALEAVLHRRWCAHNAWNFDSLVWAALFGEMQQPYDWIDSEPLARAVGLPGGLDAIGRRLWGEGKYQAGKIATKKYSRDAKHYGDAADVPAGVMPMIAEYNVQDVVLTRNLYHDEVIPWLRMPQEEWDVLAAHRAVNDRGAGIDEDLLVSLIDLTNEGRAEAVKQIAALTEGGKVELKTINDLQSRPTMFKWLDSIGINQFGTLADGSLRKQLVQQYIDVFTGGAGDEAEDEVAPGDNDDEPLGDVDVEEARRRSARTALAVRVLQLRSAALRITGGKLAAAANAVCADGRVRGLFVYAGAHTFRWSGRRVQVQNLPRPKDGLKDALWLMIDAHEHRAKKDERAVTYALAESLMPDRSKPRYKYLTTDDLSSAAIRMLFTEGERWGDERPADWREQDDPEGTAAADLSGIEARVLAHIADEQSIMRAVWSGDDLYIPMAEVIFGPWQTWPGINPGDYKTAKKHDYRQVGKIVRLGAGYQLGEAQMDIYAAANGIDLAKAGTSGPECIQAFRKFHPAIAGHVAGEYNGKPYFRDGLWQKLNDAAIAAVRNSGSEFHVGVGMRVTFVREGPHLMCYLPSGRRLMYRNARVVPTQPKFLKGTDRYIDAVEYLSPRYGWSPMYGGKWAENVVQAISRDFLAVSIVRLELAGFPVVLHVHDEAASRSRLSQKSRFMSLFTQCPTWAGNFPLDAEGGWMPRYSKSPPSGDRYKEEVYRNGSYLKAA